MCVTEIWTYRECGCSHQRRLPCVNARTDAANTETAQDPLFRSVDFTTIRHLGYRPVESETFPHACKNEVSMIEPSAAASCRQFRIVNRFIHKQFLESICDECLMDEFMSEQRSGYASPEYNQPILVADNHVATGSHVDSVIDPELHVTEKQICSRSITDGRFYAAASTAKFVGDKSALISPPGSRNFPEGSSALPFTFGNTSNDDLSRIDAANEGQHHSSASTASSNSSQSSVHHRGRQRGRTKEIRRRAIDLSRDELRISSRWSNDEQHSMKNLRDALRETVEDTSEDAFSRFVKKERASPSAKLRNIKNYVTGLSKSMSMTNLKGSLSRSRSMLGLRRSEDDITQKTEDGLAVRLTSRQQAIRDEYLAGGHNKATRSGTSNPNHSDSDLLAPRLHRRFSFTEIGIDAEETTEHVQLRDDNMPSLSRDILTWEEHLKHDLSQRQTTRKPTSLAETQLDQGNPPRIPLLPKSDIYFTSPATVTTRSSSRNSISASTSFYHTPNKSDHFPDWFKYAHLQSGPYNVLLPYDNSTESSLSTRTSERLADIIEADEFEDEGNPENRRNFLNLSDSDPMTHTWKANPELFASKTVTLTAAQVVDLGETDEDEAGYDTEDLLSRRYIRPGSPLLTSKPAAVRPGRDPEEDVPADESDSWARLGDVETTELKTEDDTGIVHERRGTINFVMSNHAVDPNFVAVGMFETRDEVTKSL